MEKINKLKKEFIQLGLDGYFIPKNDEFFGEYINASKDYLQYISNFSGSLGYALIMKKKNFSISHTSYEIIEENNKIIGHRAARTFTNVNSLLRSCDIGLSTVIIKREILKNSDCFSNMKTKEDFVFWLKLLSKNFKIYGIQIYLTKWRKLNNSLSSSVLQRLLDGFTIYNKYLKMNFVKSLYYLFLLSINSIIKKIV